MLATQKGRVKPVLMSLKRWEKDKVFSLAALAVRRQHPGQPLLHHRLAQARDPHHFVTAGFAAGYGNGGTGNFKTIGKEFDYRLVGFAVNRWRGQGKLQRLAHHAGDGVLFRARVDLDRKGRASGDIFYRDHCRAESKSSRTTKGTNTTTCVFCMRACRSTQQKSTARTSSSKLARTLLLAPTCA